MASGSEAWRSGSKRRFHDGHDPKVDGSTPIQALFSRPWDKMLHDHQSVWWNLTNIKLKKSEAKLKQKTWQQRPLSESRFW